VTFFSIEDPSGNGVSRRESREPDRPNFDGWQPTLKASPAWLERFSTLPHAPGFNRGCSQTSL
jgi:hypothetical protein